VDTIKKLGLTIGAIVAFAVLLGLIICGQMVTIYVLFQGTTPSSVKEEVVDLAALLDQKAGVLLAELARCNEGVAAVRAATDAGSGWRASMTAAEERATNERAEIRALLIERRGTR
jgi:hypothetical protein